MAVSRYRKFVRLLENWPLDEQKARRDFGRYLRERVALAFSQGEATKLENLEECDKTYEALQRISSNMYKDKYPRLFVGTCTGAPLESVREGTSTEMLNVHLRKEKSTFFKRKGKVPEFEVVDKVMAKRHHEKLCSKTQEGGE